MALCPSALQHSLRCRLRGLPVARCRLLSTLRQRLPARRWRTIGIRPIEVTTLQGLSARREREVWYTDDVLNASGLLSYVQQSILPLGYPASVSESYMSYVQWTALSLVSGRIQSLLATQAALFAIGLGKGAIPIAAAVQWVLKDGIGHAFAVLYSSSVNVKFDSDAKRYRFQATLAHTCADFIAITMMPLFPKYFFLVTSVTSATHSVAGLAQVAARARIQASFAQQGNLADVARAGQTQSKIASLLGTAIGATLSWFIGANPIHVFYCMIPLAMCSVFSSYRSSTYIIMNSLNVQRSEILFKHVMSQMGPATPRETILSALTPTQVADTETFCYGQPVIFQRKLALQPLIGKPPPGFGMGAVEPAAAAPLLSCEAQLPTGEASPWTASWHANEMYAISLQEQESNNESSTPIVLWHRDNAQPIEKIQAMWHVSVLRHFDVASDGSVSLDELHSLAHVWWPSVLAALKLSHWNIDRVFLDGYGACLNLESE